MNIWRCEGLGLGWGDHLQSVYMLSYLLPTPHTTRKRKQVAQHRQKSTQVPHFQIGNSVILYSKDDILLLVFLLLVYGGIINCLYLAQASCMVFLLRSCSCSSSWSGGGGAGVVLVVVAGVVVLLAILEYRGMLWGRNKLFNEFP